MSTARVFGGLALAIWLVGYFFAGYLLWLVYALFIPALVLTVAAVVLGLWRPRQDPSDLTPRAPRDRLALDLALLGPEVIVLPSLILVFLDAVDVISIDHFFNDPETPWHVTRATSFVWVPVIALVLVFYYRRVRALSEKERRVASLLAAVALSGWFFVPSGLTLLRLDFGIPSGGFFVLLPILLVARSSHRLLREAWGDETAHEVLAVFSRRLRAVGVVGLVAAGASMAFLPHGHGMERGYGSFTLLANPSFGVPLAVLGASWLVAASWLVRQSR